MGTKKLADPGGRVGVRWGAWGRLSQGWLDWIIQWVLGR